MKFKKIPTLRKLKTEKMAKKLIEIDLKTFSYPKSFPIPKRPPDEALAR
jgi:hypothetical protein